MKHFDIILQKKITETDLYIQELVLRKDLEGRDRLVLFSQACLALLWKFAIPQENKLELGYGLLPLLKTAYTSMQDRVVLSGGAAPFSTVFAQWDPDDIRFSSTDALALRTVYTKGADLIRLMDRLDPAHSTKYISPRSEAVLTGIMNSSLWQIAKYGSAEHLAYLLTSMAAYLTAYLEGRDALQLLSEAAQSRLVCFRNLGEIFPLTIESIQETILEDLIQVVLE